MIATAERFLGSLLGSYIGFHYHHLKASEWPALHRDALYTAWSKQPLLDLQLMDNNYLAPLPWLLYRHDNRAIRHHELDQHLDTLSTNSAAGETTASLANLYILGDSLEWLMQCRLSSQHALPKLCAYLQQQKTDYPEVLQNFALLPLTPSDTDKLSKSDNGALKAVHIALAQCLNHRENLALALNSTMSPLTRTTLGCLLGAWGGLSVIPTPWIYLLSPETTQAITQIARQLYQNWAGISSHQGTLETFPLDL